MGIIIWVVSSWGGEGCHTWLPTHDLIESGQDIIRKGAYGLQAKARLELTLSRVFSAGPNLLNQLSDARFRIRGTVVVLVDDDPPQSHTVTSQRLDASPSS